MILNRRNRNEHIFAPIRNEKEKSVNISLCVARTKFTPFYPYDFMIDALCRLFCKRSTTFSNRSVASYAAE